MIRPIATLLLVLSLGTGAAATVPVEHLQVDKAFALDVSKSGENIAFTWQIADGYYLYRDHFRVAVDGQDISFDVSEGVAKDDPGFGNVDVLYREAVLTMPAREGTAEITYQGCQEDGICYMPEVRLVDLATLDITKPAAAGFPFPARDAEPATLADAGIVLAQDSDPSGAVLGGGNPLWVAISFLGFGILLAFTPCVFLMYPIVLGMLGQGGARPGAARGFILSSTYVVALAAAFGLVGAVVGWTGQNIQFALQSPLTTAAMAVLFILLALASFGAFELHLPGFLTSRAAGFRSDRGSSVGKAAALGFTSSLIVGPCVTAPLAGALLYIGQGGDWRIGALALFMLGIGKGLPLVVLATAGSGLLPKAGRWMETVRRLFGFAFIGMAIWIAAPLLPIGYDMALYAMLVLVVCVDLVIRIRTRAARTATLALFVAGAGVAGGFVLDGPGVRQAEARIVLRSKVPSSGLTFHNARSTDDLVRQAEAADGSPMLVYVTADWCVTCRKIERSVLPDVEVVAALQGMHLVKLDVTEFDAAVQSALTQLNAAGPPTMVFFDGSLREAPNSRLVGSVSPAEVVRSAGLASR